MTTHQRTWHCSLLLTCPSFLDLEVSLPPWLLGTPSCERKNASQFILDHSVHLILVRNAQLLKNATYLMHESWKAKLPSPHERLSLRHCLQQAKGYVKLQAFSVPRLVFLNLNPSMISLSSSSTRPCFPRQERAGHAICLLDGRAVISAKRCSVGSSPS